MSENRWLTRDVRSAFGVALVIYAVVRTSAAAPFPGWAAVAPVAGAALLISAGPDTWINRVILSCRALVWIGLISFPLYLWHWPLLVFARIEYGGNPPAKLRLACVVLSVVLAWLTYRFVERPVRGGAPRVWRIAVPAVLMLAVGYAGFNDYKRDGLQFRPVIKNQSAFLASLSSIVSVYQYYGVFAKWREGTCYAPGPSVSYETRLQVCVEKRRPLVFLLGDSYAAMLYPGLQALQSNGGREFGIAEFANSNGPPFFDDNKRTSDGKSDNRTLTEINTEKIRAIASTHPALILVSWMYNGSNGIADPAAVVDALEQTVARIRAVSPVSKVLVVGPVPQWDNYLKDDIISYARSHGGQLPPAYMNYRLNPAPQQWDAYLRTELPRHGIEYVSAWDALCNESGCLTRTADDSRALTTVDWGHLTVTGSTVLVDRIKGRLFSNLK